MSCFARKAIVRPLVRHTLLAMGPRPSVALQFAYHFLQARLGSEYRDWVRADMRRPIYPLKEGLLLGLQAGVALLALSWILSLFDGSAWPPGAGWSFLPPVAMAVGTAAANRNQRRLIAEERAERGDGPQPED